MKPSMKGFGKRIEQAISIRGLSRKEAAKVCGIPLHTLHTWCREANYPTAPSLLDLCEGLKVSADWLLGVGKNQ